MWPDGVTDATSEANCYEGTMNWYIEQLGANLVSYDTSYADTDSTVFTQQYAAAVEDDTTTTDEDETAAEL